MDILKQVIDLMNKEEVRHFKLFTSRTSVDGIRKDLQLFDFIRKNDQFDEDRIFRKLYPESSKNPYYRLKNRLLSDINKSLNLQHMDDDDIVYIFHLLSLARFFQNRAKYKVAFHYIRKGEKKAIKLENYELLDFIYSELIKLSHEIVSINPEEYIQKRKENREKLNTLREIDDILAAVIYRLKVTQNYSRQNPVFDLLQKTVDDFADNPTIKSNPKLRFTLYHAVSRILLSRKEFIALEEYLLSTFADFMEEGLFNKSNHDTKLQMLAYIVNTLYTNRKLDLSLEYTERLREAMEEHGQLLYKKYLVYYYNAQIINYNLKDRSKSITIMEDLIQAETLKDMPFYDFLIRCNLSAGYFTLSQNKKAIRTLVQALIHDGYKSADVSLKLQIAIYELILRLEMSDFELVEKRIEKVRKEFNDQLSQQEYTVANKLTDIIWEMNESIEISRNKKLKAMVIDLLENELKDNKSEYTFINYTAWLREKTGISDTVGT